MKKPQIGSLVTFNSLPDAHKFRVIDRTGTRISVVPTERLPNKAAAFMPQWVDVSTVAAIYADQ